LTSDILLLVAADCVIATQHRHHYNVPNKRTWEQADFNICLVNYPWIKVQRVWRSSHGPCIVPVQPLQLYHK